MTCSTSSSSHPVAKNSCTLVAWWAATTEPIKTSQPEWTKLEVLLGDWEIYRIQSKLQLYNSNVKTVLLYGSDSWRVVQKDINQIITFHSTVKQCLTETVKSSADTQGLLQESLLPIKSKCLQKWVCKAVFDCFVTMHVFCVYFTAPPPQNVQPPAPSSSSHAPPPSSSSRYRERRTRRTHRSGGTRDDRYRSGEQEVQRQNVLHPTLVVPPRSHQRYSTLQHSFQSWNDPTTVCF